jgi:thiol-disulfide isomerase/thioredoxin
VSTKNRKGAGAGQRKPAAAQQTRKLPLLPIIGGLVTVVLIVTVFLTLGDTSEAAEEYGSPTVTGESLPVLDESSDDPAVGMPAPEVGGTDFAGNEVVVSNDGSRKIMVFLAHWCPHCQDEVPAVQGWLEENRLPEGIELYSVATSINSARDNFPPSAWLEREGWTPPVIVDDEAQTVAEAFGLSAFPYWVFIGEDGNVVGRLSGAIGAAAFSALVDNLAAQ